MSVAGIDFGNLSLLIAQCAKGGVDVILNDSSNRQTATYVSIQGKQRFIGDSGAAMARSNVTNTVSGMKLLIGRKFDDPDVQREIARNPYKCVKMPHGGVGVNIMYNDEPLVVSVEHFIAMLLVKAKEISAKASNGVNLADSVLAVPHWFTDSQRRGLLHAAEIASLNLLKITNESTAIALSYGIFKSAKKLFSETEPVHIMFLDLGYTGYSVTIVDFIQENMKVLSTVCDRQVSGREFDNIIIEFLAETFQKKTGIDVRNNKKAVLKLQAAAEKAKKTLSPAGVTEANVSVECLAEDIDLSVVLTKVEFEKRAQPLVNRLRDPIEQALREAGLTKEQISETEIVGGTSRINIVKRTVGEILGLDPNAMNYGLKTTMNADEAVARGNALQCAMLSSRMKVKPFNIIDRVAYGIVAHFEATSEEVGEGGDSVKDTTVELYKRNDELPHKPRRITFRNKTSDFTITIKYDDAAATLLPRGENREIAKFTIKVPSQYAATPSDVRVDFNLDRNGMIQVQNAQLMEEIIHSAESKEGESKEGADAKADGKEAEGKDSKESKDSKEEGTKRKFKKIDLEVINDFPGLSRDQIKAAIELEASMAFEDKLIVETADKRNELESYIYSMRDRLDGSLKEYGSNDEKNKLKTQMNQAEDWLENDGYEASKQQYAKRLDELKSVGNIIESRYNEHQSRPNAIDNLKKQIDKCKGFAANYDDAHSHITEEERDKLRSEVRATEGWLYDAIGKQGDLPLHANPVLTVDIINQKRTTLFNVFNPIATKPKPKPVETPAPQSTPSEAKSEGAENAGNKGGDDSVPMDQAKGGPEEDAKDADSK